MPFSCFGRFFLFHSLAGQVRAFLLQQKPSGCPGMGNRLGWSWGLAAELGVLPVHCSHWLPPCLQNRGKTGARGSSGLSRPPSPHLCGVALAGPVGSSAWHPAGARGVLDKAGKEFTSQSGRCLGPEIPGLKFGVCQEATGGTKSYLVLLLASSEWVLALLSGPGIAWGAQFQWVRKAP